MHLLPRAFTSLLIVLVALPSRALGQDRHVVSPSAIAATVEEHVTQEEADRAAIREALSQPQVRALAARNGGDAERLETLAGAVSRSVRFARTQSRNSRRKGGSFTLACVTSRRGSAIRERS